MLLCVAPGAQAQNGYSVTGYVRSPNRQLLGGVSVTLTGGNGGANTTRTTTTLGNGQYTFYDLYPGTFDVRGSDSRYNFGQQKVTASFLTGNATVSDLVAYPYSKLYVSVQRVREGHYYDAANLGNSYATVNVTLDGPADQTVTVNCATANDTADAGDYVGFNTVLSFPPGVTTLAVNVKTTPDTSGGAETNETLRVKLSNPVGATIADGSGAITFYEDDVAGVAPGSAALYVSDPIITEGNYGSPFVSVNVSMSEPCPGPVTVNYATADSEARANEDYVATSGTLTFAPGVTSMVVNVRLLPDASTEVNKQFKLNISGVTGNSRFGPPVFIADSQGGITVIDDDAVAPAAAPSAPSARNLKINKAPRLALLNSKRN